MHPDRLNAVDPFKVLQSAYASLVGAQAQPANYQVLGIAVLFQAYCERLGLNPAEMLHRAERIKADATSVYATHARALSSYIDGELKK